MGEETLMRSRWAKRLNSDIPRWYNARMGKLPNEKFQNLYKVIFGYADLVFIDNNHINIVEFKVRNFRGAIGQLLSYAKEVYNTVEFKPYHNLTVRLLLVTSKKDQATEEFAADHNINYEVLEV